jgi:hypothetical protein
MRYPKAVRKELNALASTAYERELDSALGDLYKSFTKWKARQIDCFELNQLIHEHHQKKSRKLWSTYNQFDEDFIVTRAVRLGVLKQGEISAEAAEAIQLDRQITGDRE